MYLYPKWLRIWHVLNALLFITLMITGISMQYTDKEHAAYVVGFAKAVKVHNFAALFFTLNYVIYVCGNFLTKNGRHYEIKRESFIADLITQAKFYAFGMFKGEKHPFPVTEESKFNPLQKFSYILAMYLALPMLIISGIGLLLPEITLNKFFGVSGLIYTDILHITMGFFLSIFMVIHVYTCTLGAKPTSLFWGMISGYHRDDH